ncbi:glycosyltransferase family 4 protein [Alteromonas sp. KUL49]|uniref:glycosyltransferase family 4 protein n=1 Tax=Alteromonas sp. KUL49 TaxID=2480798 RepID=UPI00102ED5E9|nr:glycosyltransferase family 4 protein [Alteromonas sp. KUL49]TAP41448.1 glycosyltransferase [Alteromonas sp. KUL49]GEA10525.1 glycosyl transferase [Alteromonas sp. KUL49]
MSKVNVLHLTYDMRIGGTETVIKNLIEGADQERFNNEILCIQPELGPFGEQLRKLGVTITCLDWAGGFDFALIKKIREIVKQRDIEVLHCHQYTPWVYGVLAAAFTKTKVIFTEHGRFYPDSSSWKRRLVNPLLLSLTSRVTAISQATKQALVTYEYVPEKSIRVIYNGINGLSADSCTVSALRNDLNVPEGHLVFGTVARLDPIKNQEMMISAFAKVVKDFSELVLIIVGDGEERQKLERLVDDLHIREFVRFTGYEANPVNHIALMDIFLLSSLSEGTSMTLLEALSLGKPCVVTDAGGNPELIQDNYNGLVSANNDMEGFAGNIRACCLNKALISSMAGNAKLSFSERFERSKMLEQFSDMYMSLADSH